MDSWRSSHGYRRHHQDEWSQSRPSGTRLPRRRSEPHGSANWQQQPQSQSQDVRQPAPVFSASPSSPYYSAGWTPEPATESWEEYGLIVDEWSYYKVVVKRAVFVDGDLGPLIQISESGSRVVKCVPAKQVTMYDENLQGVFAGFPDSALSASCGTADLSDFDGLSDDDGIIPGPRVWSAPPSHATTRLTKSSGHSVTKTDRRFRGGQPPKTPVFSGSRDPKVIEVFRRRVRVWKKLALPYMPIEEMGLRLWEALDGKASEKTHAEDNEMDHFAADGCDKVLERIKHHFADDAMVELGDRMDTFFDKLQRQQGETLLEYTDRCINTYRKLTDVGESLSERAKVNRLFRGSGLDLNEQRRIIMDSGGKWDFEKIVEHMRIYSRFYGRRQASSTSAFRDAGASRSASKPRFQSRTGTGQFRGVGGTRRHGVNELGTVQEDYEGSVDEDEPHEPSEDVRSTVSAEDEHARPESPHEVNVAERGDGVSEDDDEDIPIELRCELCASELEMGQAHSVNAVTPKMQNRYSAAKAGKKIAKKDPKLWGHKERETIQEIKNRTVCAVCEESGHWHTDPACRFYERTMREKAERRRAPKAGGHATRRRDNGKKKSFDKRPTPAPKKKPFGCAMVSSPSRAVGVPAKVQRAHLAMQVVPAVALAFLSSALPSFPSSVERSCLSSKEPLG